jgi:hypothetical protein
MIELDLNVASGMLRRATERHGTRGKQLQPAEAGTDILDEYIERPSIPIRWAGRSSRTARLPSLWPARCRSLGRRRHPSLYIMSQRGPAGSDA